MEKEKKDIEKLDELNRKLKKGHEPWPDNEKKVMQLGIDQLIQKKDSMRQELQTEKIGLDEMDKEVQVNIDQAAIKVKAAKMDLASMLFDQQHEITLRKHRNRVGELGQEISRHEHNIEVFQKQLDEGRPVRKKEEKKPTIKTSIQDCMNSECKFNTENGCDTEPKPEWCDYKKEAKPSEHKHEGFEVMHSVDKKHSFKSTQEAHNKEISPKTQDKPKLETRPVNPGAQ